MTMAELDVAYRAWSDSLTAWEFLALCAAWGFGMTFAFKGLKVVFNLLAAAFNWLDKPAK